MQLARYLEEPWLMWMLPLLLYLNQIPDECLNQFYAGPFVQVCSAKTQLRKYHHIYMILGVKKMILFNCSRIAFIQ